ncbi:hypothetical protein ACFFGV_20665 [Pontibacillus salicampi]|uniref:Uncharacterized protein n=1 Tax=Pontibacillus salicampi TaxID=1449801 RepID=A0ABV6LU98_9BACI
MSRQPIGIILTILGATMMVMNMYLFELSEYYDVIRRLSFISFIVGILMIPTYAKPKRNK